ncbi:MAG TPA: hypothetical protein PLD47_08450 [Aggregatilineales bacterium]|nr:hypothetical protein [Anaerolineales bacterium]HRE47741.1 hypothetical protein [Aggregatilineales bacterium]
MAAERARGQTILLGVVALIAVIVSLLLSVALLPPAPSYPTPTFPRGIELPDQLPRIPR